MRFRFVVGCLAVLGVGYAASAEAGTITFNASTSLKGTGYGTRLTILSLEATPTETGATTFAAPTGTGDSTNQDSALTIAQLQALGITGIADFGLIYDADQTGNSAPPTLSPFVVTFYNSIGGTVASFTLSPAFTAPEVQGVGGSGYPAVFGFSAAEQTAIANLFATCPTCLVGASASLSGSDDGPDSFFVFNTHSVCSDCIEVTPEPASLALLGTGLGIVAMRLRRRKRA
jgi:hypothetical protein